MRKLLITGGAVMMMAAPAFAQSVTKETTTRSTTTEMNVPAPVIVHPAPVAPPVIGGEARIEQRRSTTIDSGASGMSRTDRRSDTYIGSGGEVQQERTIRREEVR